MIKELKIFLGIFVVLAASRFIPHPPNFTSLIALSFYVPVFFGLRFIPLVVLSFVITDIFIGYHNTLFFTWGSVIVVGLISKYLFSSIIKRLSGAFLGAVLFFLITNFGVWTTGMYDYSFQGLINSYIMGLPFFGYTLISTLVFSSIIETLYKISKVSIKQIF
tara:strand:+ start:1104 stop:1592 length:489 start_codon:yes stop_codon:yes gene_type:complete